MVVWIFSGFRGGGCHFAGSYFFQGGLGLQKNVIVYLLLNSLFVTEIRSA